MAWDVVLNEPGDCDYAEYDNGTVYRCGKARAGFVIWGKDSLDGAGRQYCAEHLGAEHVDVCGKSPQVVSEPRMVRLIAAARRRTLRRWNPMNDYTDKERDLRYQAIKARRQIEQVALLTIA